MWCRRVALWFGAGVVACGAGSEAPPSNPPAAVMVVSGEPDVVPDPLPATVVDLVGRDGDVFVHFDAKAFRTGALYQAIMNVVNGAPVVRDQFADGTEKCGFDPVEALAEVAFSARVRERNLDMDTAVLAARSSQSPRANLECVQQLLPDFEQTEVDEYPALGRRGGYIVAADPFVLFGKLQPVRRALSRMKGGAGERVPPGYLYAKLESAAVFEAERIVIGLGRGPRGTELEVHARGTSVEHAQELEGAVLEVRRELLEKIESELDPAAKSLAASLVESVTFERRGADLLGAFNFGSLEREKQILGLGTAMVAESIAGSMRQAKAQEAKRVVYVIANSLREYAANQQPPRFPTSAPLVPRQVPAASRYQSADADWQQVGWKDIGFSWSPPQYYAFGFETSRGGRKVTVRAIGDFDGDGQHATFELDLEIQGGQVTGESDGIREAHPDE